MERTKVNPILPPSGSYELLYSSFRWNLPTRYNLAVDVCDRHAGSGATALIHDEGHAIRTYSFREIQTLANRLANALVGMGLGVGDRVLLQLPQHPVTAFAHVACWKAGMISVPTSVLFGVDGLEYRVTNSGARVVITDQANMHKALEVRQTVGSPQHIVVIDGPAPAGVHTLSELLERSSSLFTTLSLTPDTPAFINYTSGTTGLPKGTLQGHRSLLGHMPGVEMIYDFYPKTGDLLWSPADWAWLAGLNDVLMPAWFHGMPVLTFPMAGFDPEKSLAMMGKHAVRNVLLTPTVLRLMRHVKHRVQHHDVRLRSIGSGAEAVGKELLDEMGAAFGATITEGFGQTECNLGLSNCPGLGHSRVGALGVEVPGHVAAIVDDEGQRLPDGTTGNLAFKSPDPVMMLEYWNNPEATRKKYAGDWLITGDLATRDPEGFFWFVGRGDDVITSAGYRIGPGEIEDAIGRHPAVSLAAAIGVPDPERTESIRAYIVLAPGHVASDALADEIRASVRDRLSKHEYPREIRFIDKLPMTTTGKVVRRELRDQARAERGMS
jgi:acetyl-CoA synthetase